MSGGRDEDAREDFQGALVERGEPNSESSVPLRAFTVSELLDGTMEEWERTRKILRGVREEVES